MEDDETLASDSISGGPAPPPPETVPELDSTELAGDVEDGPVVEPERTEVTGEVAGDSSLLDDVAVDRVRPVVETKSTEVTGEVAGDSSVIDDVPVEKVSDLLVVELTGEVAGGSVVVDGGDVAGKVVESEAVTGVEIKPEEEGVEPVDKELGDFVESALVDAGVEVEDVALVVSDEMKREEDVGKDVEMKPEAEGVESRLGVLEEKSENIVDLGSSGVVLGGVGAEVAEGVVTVGSELKTEEDAVEPVEKLAVSNEMEGKNDVAGEVSLVTESVGDLGTSRLITDSDDVTIGSEMKREEEGVLGIVPTLDDVAGENLSTGTEMVLETGVEGKKGDVLKESSNMEEEVVRVKSPVTDDVAESEVPKVDIEMETEKEVGEEVDVLKESPVTDEKEIVGEMETEKEIVGEMETEKEIVGEMETEKEIVGEEVREGDKVVEEMGVSQMEVEDEMGNKDSQRLEDEVMAEQDENPVDTEMETMEKEVDEVVEQKGVSEGGKRKRGKSSKAISKGMAKNDVEEEEDVCFICFDGGDLVLCDHKGCPKAYHPSCVNRDDSYFRKGRWECGWHLCTVCQKQNAQYMCYTCTFSLCKVCVKDAVISCVRDDKGFCEACMKTVLLFENGEKQVNQEQPDFDDKSAGLSFFKDYWLALKEKLSLSLDEIAQAKNPAERGIPEEAVDGSNNHDSSPGSHENREASKNKRRKTNKRLKSNSKELTAPLAKKDPPPARKLKRNSTAGAEVSSKPDTNQWASKELLEFVMHMKNGDKSAISQFDVQALLLDYIKINKLRDPRRKSQIICDARLESLFGKPRVGHFEMLKLLESHFLIKDDPQIDDTQGTVVDDESNDLDADGTTDTPPKGGKDKKRKTRKKGQNRGRQSNLDDYAAIDMHNIGLIFLRRKLVEDLLEDEERFCDKVVGTFVRIRISASTQKQDMYRLVQVLGTGKAAEPYKVGKRTTDLMLELLNLNKKELVPIDTISNQEFTEEECKRLRQSIKCGLTSRLTVGDILDKAEEIQAVRVSDWFESEIAKVSHLRDRASEKGRRKELRECVEKLQLLKTPEERRRRLEEVPEVHADPNMDPDHESEEHESEEEDSKQDMFMKPRGSAFSRRGREPISPRGGNFSSVESWSGGSRQNSGKNYEVTRNLSHAEFSNKNDESVLRGGIQYEGSHNNYVEIQQANVEKAMSPIHSVNVGQGSHFARSESFSGAASEIPQPSPPAIVPEPAIKVNESEKMWHYKDPAGKVQGPFSVVQLRKWSKNGYFPSDLKIWKNTETEDDSILLTNALEGNFQKPLVPTKNNQSAHSVHTAQNLGSPSQMGKISSGAWGSLSVEVPKHSVNKPHESFNPPSPTPNTTTPVWNKEQTSETPHSAGSVIVQTPNFVQPNQNGSQENISPASLLISARQLMSGFENGSISSPSVGPTVAQSTAVSNDTQGWGTQQMVVPNQTVANDPQAAVGAATQNLDPNSSYSMPIQQQTGYPWVGAVPPNVQAPGSFPMPGYAAIPQPVPGNQPPFPNQVPPNVPWGMGMVQPNPSMGWGMGMGMVQGNPNMNWVPLVNPGWVAPAGNPGGPMVQTMPPGANVNQGWVAPTVNQGNTNQGSVSQGNVNQGWVPTPGWGTGTPPGNQNTGKSNSGNSGGWGTQPGNSSRQGNEGGHRSGNRYSGPRDRGGDGRPYQQRIGNRLCPYFHQEGRCKKGDRCNMVHQNPPDKM